MSTLRSSVRGALFTVACIAYAVSASAQCQITGRTTICPDSSITLCASPGDGYIWTDDGGNVLSTDACLLVSAPGVYWLYELFGGSWVGPCDHAVGVALPESCLTGSPPPPPQPTAGFDTLACPRPAGWWAKQFRAYDRKGVQIGADQLQAIATCVDSRSSLYAWPNEYAGMKDALRPLGRGMDLRERTLRQYAAVLANVCANQADLTKRNGQQFGLGVDAPFTWNGVTTTVGAWVTAAESQLASLQGASLKNRDVRAAYLSLHVQAWSIGHGHGMHTSCPMPSDDDAEDSSVLAALGPEADVQVAAAPVAMPNPFQSSMRLGFAVTDPAGSDVDVSVFDVAGRRMATLARGHFDPGTHVVQWDGRGADGARARAGMYFVRGQIGTAEVATSVMKIE